LEEKQSKVMNFHALLDLYITPNSLLIREFHLLCKNLNTFILEEKQSTDMKILLLEEVFGNKDEAYVKNEKGELVLIHYHITKIIPNSHLTL